MRSYCYYCDKDVEYKIVEEKVSVDIKGVEVSYFAQIPKCKECDSEIYVAPIDESNLINAQEEYRKQIGIITIEEIHSLLKTYDISAKNLAKLLGWGEATIERYKEGKLPLRVYSERLQELKDPNKMRTLFEQNKALIGSRSQRKIEDALNRFLNKQKKPVKVIDVAYYFLSKVDREAGSCITQLKLQKLLYYAQGWHLAFWGVPLFNSEFEAWIHGPVSREVWNHSKPNYNSSMDNIVFDVSIFDCDQIKLLDAVYSTYGIFDAWPLRDMTHQDRPWKEARKGCAPEDPCDKLIPIDSIKLYFEELKEFFDINEFADIKKVLRKYSFIS